MGRPPAYYLDGPGVDERRRPDLSLALSCGTERKRGEPLRRERKASGSRSGSSLLRGLVLPDLVAALDEVHRLPECPQVDQVPDVTWQLAEKEDGLDLLHCGWLQGGEVFPHEGGPGVAAHRVV
jgi:hypothetical protein